MSLRELGVLALVFGVTSPAPFRSRCRPSTMTMTMASNSLPYDLCMFISVAGCGSAGRAGDHLVGEDAAGGHGSTLIGELAVSGLGPSPGEHVGGVEQAQQTRLAEDLAQLRAAATSVQCSASGEMSSRMASSIRRLTASACLSRHPA